MRRSGQGVEENSPHLSRIQTLLENGDYYPNLMPRSEKQCCAIGRSANTESNAGKYLCDGHQDSASPAMIEQLSCEICNVPHVGALATTSDLLLPLEFVGHLASFLPYPDNLAQLLVQVKVTKMVHPPFCCHIETRCDVLKRTIPQATLRQMRSIYFVGTCHRDLRGLDIQI